MKKLISIIIAILVPVLMFTACSEEKPAEAETKATTESGSFISGVYIMASEEAYPDQIQIRDENKIAIQYNSKITTESGKYTVEGNVLRAVIEKNGCEYVFNIKDGSLFYDATASKPSENFVKESKVTDGAEFHLDHRFEAR